MSVKLTLADKLAARTPAKALARARDMREAGRHGRAAKLFAAAAEQGDKEAARELAMYYLSGEGGHLRSAIEAARWLTPAAEAGDAKAQLALANLFATGMNSAAATGGLFGDTKLGEPDFETALTWARKAAEAGEGEAMALLGYIYLNGPETLRDQAQALHWYERGAEAGVAAAHFGCAMLIMPTAESDEATFRAVAHLRKASEGDLAGGHFHLAVAYEHAVGMARDVEMAAELYGRAARAGLNEAQYKYGAMLLTGTGIARNPHEGETWLRRAALGGHGPAAMMVANIYATNSDGLAPNYAEAAIWLHIAAEKNMVQAAQALGVLYLLGQGVPRDPDEAAKWLRKAAELGSSGAQATYAQALAKGRFNPRITEPAPVAEWFEQAALQGDRFGIYNYAVCLADGFGIEKDEAKAAELFRQAAETVIDAQYRYGLMLAEGRGVERDYEQARVWLEKACSIDAPLALNALATLYLHGMGGPKEPQKALRLFERAAAKGNLQAMFALGALLGGGNGMEADRVASLAWYRHAAQAGHKQAALMLGKYYKLGIATAPDAEEARKWFTQARDAGVAEAQAELDSLPPPVAPAA